MTKDPEFEETIRQAQRKLRQLSFNADIEINERYLPDELISRLPKSGLIGIKAPKGCGKSVTLNKIIALAKEQGIPVLSITPRISLGREQLSNGKSPGLMNMGVLRIQGEILRLR
jgi:superfamily II DNA or RNA helicase